MKQEPFVYKPARGIGAAIDKIIAVISPSRGLRRELDRCKIQQFRYQAAQSNPGRRNSNAAAVGGDDQKSDIERKQMIWNALELIENSGLAEGLRAKFVKYVVGSLRWQARTGNKAVNETYEQYIKEVTKRCISVDNRSSLRRLAGFAVSGIVVRGDHLLNVVRDGYDLKLQGIEADRIGNPMDVSVSNNYIGGVHLGAGNVHRSYDIFTRDRRTTMYRFEENIPARDNMGMPRALFCSNPITADEIRGKTAFRCAIDNIAYLKEMRRWELMAMMWAGSRAGVFYTNNGALPQGMPFDDDNANPPVDRFNNRTRQTSIQPNTLTAMGVGEKVEMMASDRPSPNVIAMYHDTIREVCASMGVSFSFGFDVTGTGPAVRTANKQDERTIDKWQEDATEDYLDPIAELLIGNGIANGEIPYHPNWKNWEYQFPAKISIDTGRDAYSDVALRGAGAQSVQNIAAQNSQDLDEIQNQIGQEAEGMFTIAFDVAKRLTEKHGEQVSMREVLSVMSPHGSGGDSFLAGPAAAAKDLGDAANAEAQAGATSEGVPLDE